MTIKEVSERFGVSTDTLRYYERIGLIPQIARTAGGIRDYTESDISWVDWSPWPLMMRGVRASSMRMESTSSTTA